MVSAYARRHTPALAAAVAFAIAAIAFLIDRRSVWLDEADSVYFATLPFANMWHALLHVDGVFVLYYAVLHVLGTFGRDTVLFRSFSALCAVLSILPVYALANRLYGRRAAIIAAALYVGNARYLYYATEIRPYAMTLLFCAIASWLFVRIACDSKRGLIAAYVTACTLAVYSHPVAALFFVAHGVFLAILKPERKTLRTFAIGFAVAALIVLPLAVLAHADGASQLDWIGRPSVASLRGFTEGLVGPPSLVFLLAGLAAVAASRADSKMLLIWVLVPLVLAVVISIVAPASIFVARYYLFALIPIVILAARGLTLLPGRWSPACAMLLAAAVAQGLWNLSRYEGENWRAAAAYVASTAKAGEPRLIFKGMTAVPYQYAFIERAGRSDPDVLYPDTAIFDRHAAPPPAVYAKLRRAHGRVWIILSHAAPLRQEAWLAPLLREHEAVIRHFAGVDVVLLERKRPA